MGAYALFEGINELSRRCLEEALALGQKTGKHFRIARSHLFLGRLAWAEGDRDLAARKLAEAQAAAGQDVNDSDLAADLLIFRGVLAWAGGDQKEAEASLKEALKAAWRMERWGYGGAGPLDAQAQLKARQQPERAARLFGAVEHLNWSYAYLLNPEERAGREAALAEVKAALGETRMAALWAEGRAMTSEAAIAYALEEENGE